jgi:FkbM family methyltransferase
MNLGTYLREIRFAFTATRDWRNRLSLLGATARFHLHNMKRGAKSSESPLDVDIDIGGTIRSIRIRPFAGDVFVLYEVLDAETYKVPSEVIDPATVETIVDCGGNVGMTALYLASRHRNARIITVEPDPANFALLARNTLGEPRITPVQAAIVGGTSRPVTLSQDRPAWGNSISAAGKEGSGIEVPGLTLADLCQAHGFGSIDLLKVDIEGAEEDLFSAPGFLKDVRYVMIELHGAYTIDRFRRDIASHGFVAREPTGNDRPRTVTAYPSAGPVGALASPA